MSPDAGDPDVCTLCGREIGSDGTDAGTEDPFCSTGCRDVYRTLGPAPTTRGGETPRIEGDAEEADEAPGDGETERGREGIHTFFRIDGMYSATCETFLEAVAKRQEGVYDAEASYVTETIRVSHDADRVSKTDLRDSLSTLGYTAYLRETVSDAGTGSGSKSTTRQSREMGGVRKRQDDQLLEFRYAAGLLFGAFLLVPYVSILYPIHLASLVDWPALSAFEGAFELSGQGGLMFLRIYFVLTGVILVFTGLPVLRGAYVGLKMRQPNTGLLVATTAVSAYAYSTVAVLMGRIDIFYDVTVIVAAAVTAATFYESSVKQRALSRLTELTVSQVDTARMYEPGDGDATTVAVEELTAGDRVLVRQGERVPVDGTLIESDCTVDEAVVTGESLPVSKRPGETVLGGSIVTDDAAIVEVGEEATSSIDRITTAVWALQSADHGVQRRADRLAARVIWPLGAAVVLVGGAAIALGAEPTTALRAVLLVLLVGSPWALGLATPLSVATSLEEALRRGIVVFDETVFERLHDVDTVVFDKTGTLTTGEMEVIEADAPAVLLDAVAELERRASHPAANAIVTEFGRDGTLDGGVPRPGRGTGTARLGRAEPTAIGKAEPTRSRHRSVESASSPPTRPGSKVSSTGRPSSSGRLGSSSVGDGRSIRRSNLGSRNRADSAGCRSSSVGMARRTDSSSSATSLGRWDETITRLGARGTDIVVLTGDDEEATTFFGQHPHVTHVFASVPPEGKTATIRRLKAEGRVAMVGDGTNDAPALAAADLGISLGGGTALAADAADIAIADDEIGSVETAFDLARAANRRVTQNIGVALAYNAIAIPAVVAGVFNPLTAAVAVLACGGLLVANSSRQLVDAA